MTSQGSNYARFRRALAGANPAVAWSAAAELPRLDLADALALCLLLVDTDRSRYERAIARWHGRFCLETRQLGASESQLVLGALQALGGPAEAAGVEALSAICTERGHARVAEALEEWEARRR